MLPELVEKRRGMQEGVICAQDEQAPSPVVRPSAVSADLGCSHPHMALLVPSAATSSWYIPIRNIMLTRSSPVPVMQDGDLSGRMQSLREKSTYLSSR